MAYELPQKTINTSVIAHNKVTRCTQFTTATVRSFVDQFEHFWDLTLPDVNERTANDRQAIMDAIGAAGSEIIADGGKYAGALVSNFPGALPDLYHAAPFVLDTTSEPGRILVGEMVPEWSEEIERRNVERA